MNYETATSDDLEIKLGELLGMGRLAALIAPRYCTNWNATMPLAIEHGITVLSCDDIYEVSYDYEAPTGSFGCSEVLSSHIDVEKSGVLRAVVICLINKLESKQ